MCDFIYNIRNIINDYLIDINQIYDNRVCVFRELKAVLNISDTRKRTYEKIKCLKDIHKNFKHSIYIHFEQVVYHLQHHFVRVCGDELFKSYLYNTYIIFRPKKCSFKIPEFYYH